MRSSGIIVWSCSFSINPVQDPSPGVQFDDDLEEEAASEKPFWRKWKFYRNSFVFLVRRVSPVMTSAGLNPSAMHGCESHLVPGAHDS